jgi:hypothetical protein
MRARHLRGPGIEVGSVKENDRIRRRLNFHPPFSFDDTWLGTLPSVNLIRRSREHRGVLVAKTLPEKIAHAY